MRILPLLALPLAGCNLVTQATDVPSTPAQERASSYTRLFADRMNVRVDGVAFSDDPPTVKVKDRGEVPAAAWVKCGTHVVSWNGPYIEQPDTWEHIPAYAAHEVCHLKFGDPQRCGKDDPVMVERRASECATAALAEGV